MDEALSRQFIAIRKELTSYLCRMVVRPQVAEELVQTTFLRGIEEHRGLPPSDEGVRAWLFKVATNLAFDELRRHSNWRESMILDIRDAAEEDQFLVQQSLAMASTPETKAIAREHLVACLACTLRNLPERKAAALLLKEVHGFSVEDVADVLDASANQVKNWLQESRAYMNERYGLTCALIAKNGICHQCVELDGFFTSNQGNPLSTDTRIDARLKIAAELKERPWGEWHRRILALIDDMV